MITIENSKEMTDVLQSTSTEPVQFIGNTNVLLGYGLEGETIQALEEVANKSRRSLHLC